MIKGEPLDSVGATKRDRFLQQNNYLTETVSPPLEGAACKGKPANYWFPKLVDDSKAKDYKDRDKGISICRECPVRKDCLLYSLEYEPFGTWGGFTEIQRMVLGLFWKIKPKRTSHVKAAFWHYRDIHDYINNTEDQKFISRIAREEKYPDPEFVEPTYKRYYATRRIKN